MRRISSRLLTVDVFNVGKKNEKKKKEKNSGKK